MEGSSRVYRKDGDTIWCVGPAVTRWAMELATAFLGVLLVFALWLKRSFDQSLTGKAYYWVRDVATKLFEGSLITRAGLFLLRLVMVPHGSRFLPESLVGFTLAMAFVAPTGAVFLLVLASIPVILLCRASFYEDRQHPKAPGILGVADLPGPEFLIPLGMLILFLFGATVSSVVPAKSVFNFAIWCFYLLSFLLAYDSGSRGREEHIVLPILTAASFSSLVGIYQHLSGWQPPRSWLDVRFEEEIVRVVGTFSNPTFYAEVLGLALPVTLALLLKRRPLIQKGLLAVYAVLQAIALVLTYSRGAWLGFIASFALLAIFYERRLLVVGLVLGVICLALAPPVLRERLISSFTLNDSSNSYRMFIWRGSFALLRANLLRGVGLGAESFVEVYPEYMIIQTPAPHAHSVYLEMLIELGLLGFLVLMWFLLTWTWKVFRSVVAQEGRSRKRWLEAGVMAGMLAAIGGHMLQGVVEHTWYSPKVTVIYWAWLGLSAGLADRSSGRSQYLTAARQRVPDGRLEKAV